MHTLIREFRLAIRSLRSSPSFALVAILTLGVGIGTTTLMFTTANAAFLQPLPFEADGVARIWQVSQRNTRVAIPLQVWRDFQSELRSFTTVAAARGTGSVNVSNGADADRAVAASVSRTFFEALGVQPARGRGFSSDEAAPNGPAVVVISDAMWERFFGRAADVLSRTVAIEGVDHPIVGVMPPGFTYPQNADLWRTFERDPKPNPSRTAHELEVLGRLAPGTGMQAAQAELERIVRGLHEISPEMKSEGYSVRVADLRADLLDGTSQTVGLLMAAVGCLLLIACANVMNLMLARSVARRTQTTLRIALGASKRDVLRVFIIESLVLSLAGGALGALLIFWAGDLAQGLVPAALLPGGALEPDLTVFAALVVLMLVVGVLCGLLPARHASRVDLRNALASGAQSVSGEPRAMRIMVGLQVALGVVLLTGAGLLIGSLMRLEGIDPGFRREGAVIGSFSLGSSPGSRYAEADARGRFLDRLLEATEAIPGVAAAGVTSSFPFGFSPNAILEVAGEPPGQWGRDPDTHYRLVGGRYFEALGVPIRAGRGFSPADRAGAPLVALVNEATVRILWNGVNPLGRRVRMTNMDGVTEFATVVGVVADVRHRGLTQNIVSEVYFPYQQRPQRTFGMTLVAETGLDAATMTSAVRNAVREIDPAVPVRLSSIRERLDLLVAGPRFRTRLFAGFALTALALAAFGIFGVVSYSVASRTREMGVRLALGARASSIRRLVIGRALYPVGVGLIVGTLAAMFASRLLGGLLVGIERTDPIAYLAASVVLLAAAVLAAWWPAHRATRVDPLLALRAQ
jgi:putative ABC transport system permease protein